MKKNKKVLPSTFIEHFENNIRLQLIILLLLPLVIYLKVIDFEFLQDDLLIVKNNIGFLEDFRNIPDAFTRDAFCNKSGQTGFYRPVQTISYMIDAFISGDSPAGYHITNLLLHLAACVTFFFFLKSLALKNLTVFFTSVVFAVHPLLACAVSWTPSRGDVLISLFILLLLMTMKWYFDSGKIKYFFVHGILFFLAIFSKETALISPLLFILYYFVLLKPEGGSRKLFPFIAVWICLSALFLFLEYTFTSSPVHEASFGIAAVVKNYDMLLAAIGKSAAPIDLPLLYAFDTASMVLGGIVLLFLLAKGIQYRKTANWIFVLGFFWFGLFMLPPLFSRPLDYERAIYPVEQRMYLPLIGFMIMIASLAAQWIQCHKKPAMYLTGVLVCTFAVLAYMHSDDYRSPFRYCDVAIEHNPDNAGAYTYRGYVYFNTRGDIHNSMDDFNKAITICNYPQAYFNRAALFTLMKDDASAERDYTSALEGDSTLLLSYLNRALSRISLKNYQGALSDLNCAAQKDSTNVQVLFQRGSLFLTLQNPASAIYDFSKSIALNPEFQEAYGNRALAEFQLGYFDKAIDDCNRLLQFNPHDLNTLKNLGQAYREAHRFKESIDTYGKAISYSQGYAPAYFGRALTKQAMNDMHDACSDWQEALQLGFLPAKEFLQKYCR